MPLRACDAHDPLGCIRAAKQAKRGRELQLIAEPVGDPRRLAKVRIQLDVVGAPHGQLRVARIGIPPALLVMPGPGLVRVERIQVAFQSAGLQIAQVVVDVADDIVRVRRIVHKRAVDRDRLDPDRGLSRGTREAVYTLSTGFSVRSLFAVDPQRHAPKRCIRRTTAPYGIQQDQALDRAEQQRGHGDALRFTIDVQA